MKKLLSVANFLLSVFVLAQEAPKINKQTFNKESLSQTVLNQDGKNISIGNILKQNKGKIIVLDLWASWCHDCVNALPKAKILEKQNPNVEFIYLSLDRNPTDWKKGIEKHELEHHQNFLFSSGWKNKFNNYIELNWIPRYLIVDQKSNIAKYYAISPDDPEIQKTINQLSGK